MTCCANITHPKIIKPEKLFLYFQELQGFLMHQVQRLQTQHLILKNTKSYLTSFLRFLGSNCINNKNLFSLDDLIIGFISCIFNQILYSYYIFLYLIKTYFFNSYIKKYLSTNSIFFQNIQMIVFYFYLYLVLFWVSNYNNNSISFTYIFHTIT